MPQCQPSSGCMLRFTIEAEYRGIWIFGARSLLVAIFTLRSRHRHFHLDCSYAECSTSLTLILASVSFPLAAPIMVPYGSYRSMSASNQEGFVLSRKMSVDSLVKADYTPGVSRPRDPFSTKCRRGTEVLTAGMDGVGHLSRAVHNRHIDIICVCKDFVPKVRYLFPYTSRTNTILLVVGTTSFLSAVQWCLAIQLLKEKPHPITLVTPNNWSCISLTLDKQSFNLDIWRHSLYMIYFSALRIASSSIALLKWSVVYDLNRNVLRLAVGCRCQYEFWQSCVG